MPDPQQSWISQWSWLGSVRWGHGLIAKVCLVALSLFVVIGIGVARVPSEYAIIGLVIFATLVFFGFLAMIFAFARDNPNLAATEGATYVQARQLDWAAKSALPPPVTVITGDPQQPTFLTEDESNAA